MRGPTAVSLVIFSLLACGEAGEQAEVSVPAGGIDTPAGELVAVRHVRIGASADEARGVSEEVTTFQPGDSVFLSAELEGNVSRVIVIGRFSHQSGSIVGEEERFLSLSGREIVTFDLAPLGGLAPGRYRAELLLGTERVGEKEFTVGG